MFSSRCCKKKVLVIIPFTMSTKWVCVRPLFWTQCCNMVISVMMWIIMKSFYNQNQSQTNNLLINVYSTRINMHTVCFICDLDFNLNIAENWLCFYHQYSIRLVPSKCVHRPPCQASSPGLSQDWQADSGTVLVAAGLKVCSLIRGSPSSSVPAPPAEPGPPGPSAHADFQSLAPEIVT